MAFDCEMPNVRSILGGAFHRRTTQLKQKCCAVEVQQKLPEVCVSLLHVIDLVEQETKVQTSTLKVITASLNL